VARLKVHVSISHVVPDGLCDSCQHKSDPIHLGGSPWATAPCFSTFSSFSKECLTPPDSRASSLTLSFSPHGLASAPHTIALKPSLTHHLTLKKECFHQGTPKWLYWKERHLLGFSESLIQQSEESLHSLELLVQFSKRNWIAGTQQSPGRPDLELGILSCGS
jgi:hypothetical protein